MFFQEEKNMNERNEFGERNFFYSANSEAYQDAFLTWIFYNFTKDEPKTEIEKFSKYFLEYLSKIGNNGEKIETVEVDTQVKNSDIILNIKTNKNEYLVIIEDKTGSSIHSSNKSDGEIYKTQLEKYYDKFLGMDEYVKYFTEKRVFLYYYKNEFVNEYEKNTIIDANSRCKVLLKKQYEKDNDASVKICEGKIEKCNKRIKKINAYKRQSTIAKYQNELEEKKSEIKKINQELESLDDERKSIDSIVNKCFREWEILDIDKIDELFKDFEKHNGKITNQIISEYSQSIDFWKKQIDRIDSRVFYSEKDPDFLWKPQSKIWNPIFASFMESIKGDSLEDRFSISTYNGKYWQFAYISNNYRTCILMDVHHICNDSVTITINLRNDKYKDQGLPLKNKKEREQDRKRIVDKFSELGKNNCAWEVNNFNKSGDSSNDINLLARYTVKTQKTSLKFLIETWKKVEEDLRDLEYTDFKNETIKVFER